MFVASRPAAVARLPRWRLQQLWLIEKNVVEVINLTAAATGVSVSSVYEIKRGFKRANGAVKSPSKKRPKFTEKRKRIANHETCTLTAIPTLKKIAARLQEDDVLPSCSGTTLYRLLKDMSFEKQKRNRNSFLIKREDIVEWRRRYLKAIGKHRAQNRKIYFQDETWVNAGLTVDKLNLEPVIIPLDASDTEEEIGDDDEADDENEGEEIFGVQPLEWN
ncbi:hypothetical protein HPB47_018678 [Ixodes persulcatus]|uniref:Uncharacterized protein n=1 Tax=Ixodes persulcatus TaxID=34615 RepID=A0AC60QKB6_IXOPE|nr:hypothetical protein HPB47_018678 [Ixodes persulcatus]